MAIAVDRTPIRGEVQSIVAVVVGVIERWIHIGDRDTAGRVEEAVMR